MRPQCHRASYRTGFSLIELLITITIMAIVISLIVAFLGVTGSAAREAATRATIMKLDALLQARFRQMTESFADQERKSAQKAEWTNITYSASQYLGGTESAAAKKAMVKLNRYRGSFPQRLADLAGLAAGDTNPRQSSWSACTNPNELLYQILTYGGVTGAEKEIFDSINPRHIMYLTPGSTLRAVFVDDWGNPLRFYHSPTKLVRPDNRYLPTSAQQYSLAKSLISTLPPLPASATDFTSLFNQDPLDPRGALRKPSFSMDQGRYFDYPPIVPASTTFEEEYYTPDTWYVPLIVSCGADEALGLEEPGASNANRHAGVLNADDIGDNITNLQSVGGQK